MIGRLFAGRYHIDARLGQGGFGSVYRAEQEGLSRHVALKVIRRDLAAREEMILRFQREMKATARIEHPNTVRLYDFGQTEDGALYLAMELLQGRTLTEALTQDGPMPPERVAHVGAQIAEALWAAHSEGVIHRDLKPDNVMLLERYGRQDQVKVLDFGIARLTHGTADGPSLTTTGAIMGTPSYMSPEQITGQPVDAASDLYALGVVLYRLICGKLPFAGQPPNQLQ